MIDRISKLPFIDINKKGDYYSPYVLSISFKKTKGETVMHYLEENNIIVGVGSACNEKTKTLERSVYALTNSIERSYNMIRISLSHHNTYQEIDYLIEKLQELGNR